MLAVWIFNFAALTVAKLLIYGILFYTSRFMTSDFPIDYNMTAFVFYIQIVLKSVVTVTIGFIALFVGRVFKSSKATIVASFLLFFLMNGTVGDFTLADNAILPIVLTVVSLSVHSYLYSILRKGMLCDAVASRRYSMEKRGQG